MSAHQARILGAGLVGAAVLTAVYFLVAWSAVIHCAYCFLLLALALACGALWQLSQANKDGYFTGLAFPLALKGLLLTSAAVSLAVAALALSGLWNMPWRWFCIVQLAILTAAGWRMFMIGAGEEVIQAAEGQVREQTSGWMLLRADSEALLREAPSAAQADFARVRDALRYADPMSVPELSAIDAAIRERLAHMRELAAQGEGTAEAARQIENLVQDRATRLKLMK